ncbi:MAG: hypothetical protein U9O87_00940, partial [Verrucomicrobiota bacterium]|nr:hypothetical protein [Verrucomicrobiota bacterium]
MVKQKKEQISQSNIENSATFLRSKSSKKMKFILLILFPITVFIALIFFFYKGEKTSNSSQNTKFQQTIERKQTGVVLPTIQKNKIEE